MLSLGAEFEVLDAPTAAPAPAPAPSPPPAGAAQPLRKSLVNGSLGLIIALGGLLGAHPGRLAAVQVAVAAYLIFELLQAGLARIHATSRPHRPLAGALAVVAGVVGLIPDGADQALAAPILAILGGLLALAAPSLAQKADSKLPPASADLAMDPQFSKLLLGNLLILAGAMLPWSSEARGVETILGSLLLVFCLLAIFASWVGMNRTWAMPVVSGGLLGMVLLITPVEGLMVGVFGIVRLFATTGPDSALKVHTWWPGTTDTLTHGLPIFLVIAASLWSLTTVIQGTMKGVAAQKKRKEEEVAARKVARASKDEKKA